MATSDLSCQGYYFCGTNARLQEAAPTDLQIVCNITSQEVIQGSTLQVIPIKEIRIHPNYVPLTTKSGPEGGGPINGYDISVYIVDDSNFTMHQDFIWPACLPRAEEAYIPGNRGILAGWLALLPTSFFNPNLRLINYQLETQYEQESLYERVPCSDPAWMKSNTYYPFGTLCFADAALASALNFGVSGSGIMRPFLASDGQQPAVRYSWAGPLSLSKGNDYTVRFPRQNLNFIQGRSSNPSVFTDGRCYMGWIAAQYNLNLPAGYTTPCSESAGSKTDTDSQNCRARTLNVANAPFLQTSTCSTTCTLFAFNPGEKPATYQNFFKCTNTEGATAVCANNCPGVDPNAVVVGGEAALFAVAAAAGAANPVTAALGAGSLLAMLGAGSFAMRRSGCPPPLCRAVLSQTCCTPIVVNGRRVCPLQCDDA